MKLKIDWLDDLTGALKETRNEINDTEGCNGIEKILNPDFMSKYTQFFSIKEMFEKSGYAIVEQDDLQKTCEPDFNHFVKKTTDFSSWDEMTSAAGKEFVKQKITDL